MPARIARTRVIGQGGAVFRRDIRVFGKRVCPFHVARHVAGVKLVGRPSVRLFVAAPLYAVRNAIVGCRLLDEKVVRRHAHPRQFKQRDIQVLTLIVGHDVPVDIRVARRRGLLGDRIGHLREEVVYRHRRSRGINLDAYAVQYAQTVHVLARDVCIGIALECLDGERRGGLCPHAKGEHQGQR